LWFSHYLDNLTAPEDFATLLLRLWLACSLQLPLPHCLSENNQLAVSNHPAISTQSSSLE
jgi:hypothetical protein